MPGSRPSLATHFSINFCRTWWETGTRFRLMGRTNAEPSASTGVTCSMLVYASNGHRTEPGIARTGTSNTLLPNWFVLLYLNCTSSPFSPINTSERHNWRLLSKAFLPVTTRFDFLESVKKATSNKAHKVASKGVVRSSRLCTLQRICGDSGAACRTACGFDRLRPLRVNFSSMLSVLWNGASNRACSVRTPLI